MGFLNNIFLWSVMGAIGVSVPIIIHLLNRRKFERVVWAAMRFLRVSVEQNQRRLKIEDLLLLLLRCLLVLLLALALARPVLRATSAASMGANKVTGVVVLDNSASMAQNDGVQSRFEAAKKAADDIIRNLPTGSSVAVVLASDEAQSLIAEPTFDLALASQTIKDAPLHDRPSNLIKGVQSAVNILGGRRPSLRREIYILTDGQALAFRQLAEIRKTLDDQRRDVRAHILILGDREERNLGISAVSVEKGIVPVNEPVRVNVAVKNYSRTEAVKVNVFVGVDGDKPMDEGSIDSIPAGEERSISLYARIKADGFHTISARLDADRYPADDWRTVAVRVVKQVKVLLIDGDPGTEARASEVFYLRNALRPVPRAQWEEYFVKPTVKTPTELDGVRFEDFDAVFCCNVTDFSPGVLGQLGNYIKTGGAMAVFPGDGVNVNYYNDQLHDKAGILPARLGPAFGDARSQERYFSLQDKNYNHELVSLWADAKNGSLTTVRFFRAFELIEGKSDQAKSQVILRFADGKPAIISRDIGLGRVLLFASTVDTGWNDLPARAGIFVPLMQRTLGLLAARQDEHLTVRVGQPFIHISPVEYINKDAAITKSPRHFSSLPPEAKEVQESRRIELVENFPLLRFNETSFAGAYEAKVGDAAPIRFAAQAEAEESNLELLSPEQLKLLDEVAHVVKWSPGANLADRVEQGRVGSELWVYIIPIALLLAVMETLFAHWFSKSK